MSDLKPCPFCGTPDPYFYDPNEWKVCHGKWIVECSNDDCTISVQRNEESEVIELWNTRPLTTTQSTPVDKEAWEAVKKTTDALNYIKGIVERGIGHPLEDDVTIENAVLNYVKSLEATQSVPSVGSVPRVEELLRVLMRGSSHTETWWRSTAERVHAYLTTTQSAPQPAIPIPTVDTRITPNTQDYLASRAIRSLPTVEDLDDYI